MADNSPEFRHSNIFFYSRFRHSLYLGTSNAETASQIQKRDPNVQEGYCANGAAAKDCCVNRKDYLGMSGRSTFIIEYH